MQQDPVRGKLSHFSIPFGMPNLFEVTNTIGTMRSTVLVIQLLFFTALRLVNAQTATEVLDNLATSWLSGIENVEDFTVVGESFTSYHKKYLDSDGVPYFKESTEDNFSGMNVGNMTTMLQADDWNELRNRIGEVAEYGGRADVRGINAHVVRLTNFAALDPGGSGSGEQPDSVLFFIDPDGWLLARIILYGSTANTQRSSGVTPMIDFENYQEIGGMNYPFLTRVTMVGMQVTVTQAQVDEARESIEKLEERLASLPAAQRDMMMSRIQPTIDRMQQMVESGTLETTFEVTDVRINEGLSDSIFN